MGSYTQRVLATDDDTYSADSGPPEDRTAELPILAGHHPSLEFRFAGGLRFTGVDIPKGAAIVSAILTVIADRNEVGNVDVNVYGEDADNPPNFDSEDPWFIGRVRTTATVFWPLTAWIKDTEYSSPDIKSIIQEIINRPGWVSGNVLILFIEDDGSSIHDWRVFYAYDASTTKCALLTIEYTTLAKRSLGLIMG